MLKFQGILRLRWNRAGGRSRYEICIYSSMAPFTRLSPEKLRSMSLVPFVLTVDARDTDLTSSLLFALVLRRLRKSESPGAKKNRAQLTQKAHSHIACSKPSSAVADQQMEEEASTRGLFYVLFL